MAERIRDEKLATAKKGLRGSGICRFGYKFGRKEVITRLNRSTKTKKNIWNCIWSFRSCNKYKLIDEKIFIKAGKAFRTGNLYKLLKRKVYIGKVEHKVVAYDGIHEEILDEDIFYKVQDLLKENNKSNKQAVKVNQPSLLSGKLFDDNHNIMSLSHAN